MLSKTEMVEALAQNPKLRDSLTTIGVSDNNLDRASKNVANIVLVDLQALVTEELEKGQDVTVPGIVKLSYDYKPAEAKGARWKKGETVVGFGGVESVKESDSPAKKERVRLVPRLTGAVARMKPGSKPEAQAEFLKSKTGKAVRSAKAK